MTDKTLSKKWYASKTVWGGIVAIGAGIAGAFGVSLGQEVQADLTSLFVQAGAVVGGALAVFGRIKAEKPIK